MTRLKSKSQAIVTRLYLQYIKRVYEIDPENTGCTNYIEPETKFHTHIMEKIVTVSYFSITLVLSFSIDLILALSTILSLPLVLKTTYLAFIKIWKQRSGAHFY